MYISIVYWLYWGIRVGMRRGGGILTSPLVLISFGAKFSSYCIIACGFGQTSLSPLKLELENASSRFQSVDNPANLISIIQSPNRGINQYEEAKRWQLSFDDSNRNRKRLLLRNTLTRTMAAITIWPFLLLNKNY